MVEMCCALVCGSLPALRSLLRLATVKPRTEAIGTNSDNQFNISKPKSATWKFKELPELPKTDNREGNEAQGHKDVRLQTQVRHGNENYELQSMGVPMI
jgi:hypothetical protein